MRCIALVVSNLLLRASPHAAEVFRLLPTALLAYSVASGTALAASHTITVAGDGTYDPRWLYIDDGDTVTWQFPDRRRAVVRVHPDGTSFPEWCQAYVPYDANDPNEFTGPMPVAASGIFALGPDELGSELFPDNAAAPCFGDPAVNGILMCDGEGDLYAPLQLLLDSPDVAGVFLRPLWNTVETAPGVYDWDDLDTQIQRVVEAGKLYSLGFKAGKSGTPEWLNTDLGLSFYTFNRDDPPGSGADCDVRMRLADPTDPLYSERYAAFLRAVGAHIQENPAHFRALAYFKPSGANYTSHENRLPRTCESGCTCNTAVWAGAGYTPPALYDFYKEQTTAIADAFPGKSMSYQLIQDGFPQVASATEYLGCTACAGAYPSGAEQTNSILNAGQSAFGTRWIVQHNGLNTKPPAGTCLNENVHPVQKPVFPSGSHCPNPYVLREAAEGQVTGFQTTNPSSLSTLPDLDSALSNALENSDGVFVEVYERLLWEAVELGEPLDAAATPRTLGDWNQEFMRRRRASQFTSTLGLADPYPNSLSHVFTRTIGAIGNEIYHYVDPAVCGDGAVPEYGVIVIRP